MSLYQYRNAEKDYREAIKRYKSPSEVYFKTLSSFGLADALEGCGKFKEALALMADLLEMENVSKDEILKAVCLSASGEYFLAEWPKKRGPKFI